MSTQQPDDWRTTHLDDRQRQEAAFATLYATQFNHGTTGHNQLVLIHRLVELVEYAVSHGGELPPLPDPADIVLTFGKYRGLSLLDVARQDSDYLDWLSREGREESLRTAAAAVLDQYYDDGDHDDGNDEDDPPF